MRKLLTSALLASALLTPLLANAQGEKDKYSRPKGCFYVPFCTQDGQKGIKEFYNAPYIHIDAYRLNTYVNNRVYANNDTSTYRWMYFVENPRTRLSTYSRTVHFGYPEFLWIGSENSALRITPGVLTTYVPLMTHSGEEYRIGGYQSSSDGSGVGRVRSYQFGYPNSPEIFSIDSDIHHWSSSKYFASSTSRDGAKSGGSYSIGAGSGKGQLFGKNSNNYNGLGVAFEEPANPYLVKAMAVQVRYLELAHSSVDMTMTIYRLNSIPNYVSGSTVTLTPGEVIASKTITVDNNYLAANLTLEDGYDKRYKGLMQFRLDDMCKIDGPILVAFTGYNSDAVVQDGLKGFTTFCSTDYYDEGFGELGYILEGTTWKGLTNFSCPNTTLTNRKSAPAIFIEVEKPLLYWLNTSEKGVHDFDAAEQTIQVPIFSSRGADPGYLTVSAPDWVNVSMTDHRDNNNKYANKTVAEISVSALPEGETSRTGTVVFNLNGCRTLEYVVNQHALIADYKRPQGCYYWTYTTVDGDKELTGWQAPRIHIDPLQETTFRSNGPEGSTYEWSRDNTYSYWDFTTGSKVENAQDEAPAISYTNQNLTFTFNKMQERNSPTVKISVDGVSDTFRLGGYDPVGGFWASTVYNYPNHSRTLEVKAGTFNRHALSSANYFGLSSDRFGYFSQGDETYPLIVGGEAKGELFGRNTAGYNALGAAFEAPIRPYLLRATAFKFERLELADPVNGAVDLTMRVYKLNSIPAYDDVNSVVATPGELLKSVTVTVNKEYLDREFNLCQGASNSYYGIMMFPFKDDDNKNQLLPVEGNILITLEGIDNPALKDFAVTYSTDHGDEGFGELGYIATGNGTEARPFVWHGINNIIDAFKGVKTAPALFAEVERPFLKWYDETTTKSCSFETIGQSVEVDVYASRGAKYGAFEVQHPDWVTVELIDHRDESDIIEDDVVVGQNDTYKNITTMKITAKSPYASTQSARYAPNDDFHNGKVKLILNGVRSLEYSVSREPGVLTGILDVTDSKEVVSVKYVSAAGFVADKPFDGVNMKITQYRDGTKKTEKIVK